MKVELLLNTEQSPLLYLKYDANSVCIKHQVTRPKYEHCKKII